MVNPLQQTDKEIKNITPENKVLLDWGSKTYERIGKKILNSNCVMIIGKFSPSDVDDVYEKYGVITSAIHDRKTYLKENFEMMDIEDKKPIDDLKSRKFLLNFFLKSKTTYDLVKYHFKQILNKLSGANPNVNFIIIYYLIIIQDEEEEVPAEDEQFTYEINQLVDYYINESFNVIDEVLMGTHIPGNYKIIIIYIK